MNYEAHSISELSPHLFWDVDATRLDWQAHRAMIVEKVLEYGMMDDWKLLKRVYGLEEIKTVAIELRALDDVTVSFLSSIFGLQKEAFRCYRLRQLNPNAKIF